MPFFEFRNIGSDTVELDIFDKVIGWDVVSREFKTELEKASKANKIVLNINSPGGVITEGMAMYALLRQYAEKITVRVYGVAASIASVIALAGDRMEMMEGSMYMIHDPFIAGFVEGNAEELESLAEALRKMKTQIAQVYMRKTGLSEEEVFAMMSKETWLTSDEAVELGFADSTVETYRAAACFDFPTAINQSGIKKYQALHAKDETEKETTPSPENSSESVLDELLLKVTETLNIAKTMSSQLTAMNTEAPASTSDSPAPSSANGEAHAEADFLSLLAQAATSMKQPN